ncbi:uncharacterized protein BKA78DRAFT_313393 [Phyllosticta capitalensis]|uniref:uncharacterized protein n=1 Tax=Phyllosticta capitalensis TaxID=121624 RepID=UPI00312F6C55
MGSHSAPPPVQEHRRDPHRRHMAPVCGIPQHAPPSDRRRLRTRNALVEASAAMGHQRPALSADAAPRRAAQHHLRPRRVLLLPVRV